MPEDEYNPLKELVLDPKLDVVRALADLCHTDRIPLATSLLRIFRSVGCRLCFETMITVFPFTNVAF